MTGKEKTLKELKLEEKKLLKKLEKVQNFIKAKKVKKKKKKAPKKDDQVTADIVLREVKTKSMRVRDVFNAAEAEIKQHLKGKTPKNTLDALMQRMVKRGDLVRVKQNNPQGKLVWYYGLPLVKQFQIFKQ